eukprot:CAMPEP_0178396642 /NCGR_PEP_ID=MMETSP0689_2-20121128/13833_1 /TAXON_ID=160604 /ORGANISM="Amphidinium massartii, Strain CS-259" /LENGTH=253 /DNA_ID=CAMNT_0020017321 /DNA_START=26 /DNA_END=784 /DNA_ORIENTATION=+
MRPKAKCTPKKVAKKAPQESCRKEKASQPSPQQKQPQACLLSEACRETAAPTAESNAALAVAASDDFRIEAAAVTDASDVQSLYSEYVQAHVNCYAAHPNMGDVSFEEWAKALSAISFDQVLSDIQGSAAAVQQSQSAPQSPTATGKKAGSQKKRPLAEPVPGVLKCIARGATPADTSVVGYLLYELREKGEKKKKQRFCEIVNLVVSESHRGHGAGNLLLQGLTDYLEAAAVPHAGDLRLFVAAGNKVPREW